jgi:hypothetical protein
LLKKQQQVIAQHTELLNAQKALLAEQAQTISMQTERLASVHTSMNATQTEVGQLTGEQTAVSQKLAALESSLKEVSVGSVAVAAAGVASAELPVEILDKIVKCFQATCLAFSRNQSVSSLSCHFWPSSNL